ncbi:hypothetical protein [Epilithonimonas xixisoli]|uniref:Uncharacterized protein n=1 Tax=Epilithonimonas xixisoli TaxID=1476462 RepID=A0A4R8I520_9FLAO|nr:hypothetical protein [Epilithonimonas xixisoli]TDX83987.1 hypothetical protein B0I22_1575 [Epilithonimonas xixisoli]
MVRRYYLYKQESTEEAVQSLEGDFSSAPPEWILHSKCEDEVNGSGRSIALADGSNYVFTGVIYLDSTAGIIPEGQRVLVSTEKLCSSQINDESQLKTLRQEGKIRLSGIVKGFEKSKLNIRLWV